MLSSKMFNKPKANNVKKLKHPKGKTKRKKKKSSR